MGNYHERIVSHARYQEGQTSYYVELTVDSAADMPDPSQHPEWEIGSELYVLENGGARYRLSNSRTWVQVNFKMSEGGGDASNYLKAFESGIAISTGMDLNTIMTAGSYRAQSKAIAGSLYHCPASDGFRLEVKYLTDATRLIQLLYPNHSEGCFYIRNYTSSGWGSWFQYSGEAVTVNTPSATAMEETLNGSGEPEYTPDVMGNEGADV